MTVSDKIALWFATKFSVKDKISISGSKSVEANGEYEGFLFEVEERQDDMETTPLEYQLIREGLLPTDGVLRDLDDNLSINSDVMSVDIDVHSDVLLISTIDTDGDELELIFIVTKKGGQHV